jgi:hypothetical protein
MSVLICDKCNKLNGINNSKNWSVCKVRVFHVNFSFLTCPDCKPKFGESENDVWYSEMPFEKWLLPHLKFSVIKIEDFY